MLASDMQQVLNDYYQANFPAYSSLTPTLLRQRFNVAFKNKATLPEIQMKKIETINISGPYGDIQLRIYFPFNVEHSALMYFHGGGFVIRDDMEIYDHTCRLVAYHTGAIIIAVNYMLDLNFNRDSYQQYATGYVLTRDTMQWFWQQYLAHEADKTNPYALPVLNTDLKNLSAALVVTTEYDVLKDEGEYYSQLLQQNGVPTKYICYEGIIHGFFDLFYKVENAKIACLDIIKNIKLLLA